MAGAFFCVQWMKRSLPPSPAADEPDEPPSREAVVSEDTKTYDRGRPCEGETCPTDGDGPVQLPPSYSRSRSSQITRRPTLRLLLTARR
eukprot:COSAG01_NODE_2055_length_8535_cov_16.143314_7_plen_89_part_00